MSRLHSAEVVRKIGTRDRFATRAALVFLFATISVAIMACHADETIDGSASTPEGQPKPENLMTVETLLRPTLYEAVGTVRSRATATVSSQVVGRIVLVLVDAGTKVDAGMPLARIDDQEFSARLEQARSALRAAEAGREQADASYARMQELTRVNAASTEEFEIALMGARQSAASVDSARERLREARVAYEHTRVKSPIGGVVEQRMVDPGDLALPGKALFVIHHPEDLRLEANVREGAIDQIQMGQEVAVTLVSTDQSLIGVVSEIVPSADPISRSFLVKVTLPPSRGVYPGMFGKLAIPIGERYAIVVPSAAIMRVGQLTTLQVRVSDRYERRYVSIGEEVDGQVEVLSGLSAGETIGWDSSRRSEVR